MEAKINVLGEPLAPCSTEPLTGFFRDGCCNTAPEDRGLHAVCTRVTAEFLEFSRSRGNDLTTPMPEFGLAADTRMECKICWQVYDPAEFSERFFGFGGIDAVKFRRPVVPGDQLRFEVEMLQFSGRRCRMKGKAYVEDKVAAEAEMAATIMDR